MRLQSLVRFSIVEDDDEDNGGRQLWLAIARQFHLDYPASMVLFAGAVGVHDPVVNMGTVSALHCKMIESRIRRLQVY